MAGKVFGNPLGTSTPTIRKHLNADALFALVRDELDKVDDRRVPNMAIPLGDGLMSGFAIFSMKPPSLFAFDERRQSGDPNLQRVYGIEKFPCDTQM